MHIIPNTDEKLLKLCTKEISCAHRLYEKLEGTLSELGSVSVNTFVITSDLHSMPPLSNLSVLLIAIIHVHVAYMHYVYICAMCVYLRMCATMHACMTCK